MVTYFLGHEEVSAYLRDFLVRLEHVEAVPTVWCPLTRSGNELLNPLLDIVAAHHPKLADSVSVLPIEVEDGTNRVRFLGGDSEPDLRGKQVLIFDGAIHSGRMMNVSVSEVLQRGAAGVCTYSLVLKRGSAFIPTLWGVTINDVDRSYFLLNNIPNNRLDAGSPHSTNKKTALNIHIRLLAEADSKKPLIECDVKSMDRVTWGDRYFAMKAGGQRRCTYVVELAGAILGYLTVSMDGPHSLSIDEVAVDKAHRGRNLGAVLIRFADTLARQFDCRAIQLQSIATQRDFYQLFGYKVIVEAPLRLDDEEYWLMEKSVIHNPTLLQ